MSAFQEEYYAVFLEIKTFMSEVTPWELHLIHYYRHLEIQDRTWQVWEIFAVPVTRGSISQASSRVSGPSHCIR